MRRFAWVCGLLMTFVLVSTACDKNSDQEILQATLSGAGEVPANGSGGTGAAGFVVSGNTVRWSLEINNMQNVIAAHIHSGAAGVNGPVRVPLYTGATKSGVFSGVLSEGTFSSTAGVNGITFDQVLTEMRNGTAYVNVHTLALPGGEIRGQVQPVVH